MIRSYDPSGIYEFPDSYEDEPSQLSRPSTETRITPMTEERYQELMRHWGAVAKARKVRRGGST